MATIIEITANNWDWGGGCFGWEYHAKTDLGDFGLCLNALDCTDPDKAYERVQYFLSWVAAEQPRQVKSHEPDGREYDGTIANYRGTK